MGAHHGRGGAAGAQSGIQRRGRPATSPPLWVSPGRASPTLPGPHGPGHHKSALHDAWQANLAGCMCNRLKQAAYTVLKSPVSSFTALLSNSLHGSITAEIINCNKPTAIYACHQIAGTEGLYTELQGKMMGNKATE
ncbi:uncharacterized protein [Triticum aestivum]|uniref:uncharacterized protein n=1 Tax=Triticum aestivum TaxID=4565 RepID=UPI001D02D358|nr:uncharacterized protein LOC123119016 [Triticum aestivum]